MRILVVDANAQRGFATVPIDAKRRVVGADNGRDALDRLSLYRPDLFVSAIPTPYERRRCQVARPLIVCPRRLE